MNEFALRALIEDDVTQSYVDWFSDVEVTKFSNNQYRRFSLEGQRAFVRNALNDPSVRLFGIFAEGNIHIGNVVLAGIDMNHRRAEVTYVVGRKECWGRGVATYAVGAAIRIAREELGLLKLYAGCASANEGSKRVLMKNGFVLEGVRKSHSCFGGVRYDQLDFGLLLG